MFGINGIDYSNDIVASQYNVHGADCKFVIEGG